MEFLFLKILNMSITAGYLVLAVIALRFILKKAPKSIRCIMWAMVGVRLICPFNLESSISLIPSAETIPSSIINSSVPTIQSGIPALNSAVNSVVSGALTPQVGASANPIQIITFVACVVWLIGIAGMLIYTLISYLRIYKKVREAVPMEDNIWIGDQIDAPFIFGIFRPRIYLPASMNQADMQYVISHENAHIKRRDYIWKPLAFLLLTVYWFNPILWLAYVLLCRDIEFACDEKVMNSLAGDTVKKDYSNALINCSVTHKMVLACPIAFGEVGVKGRIKNVLNYKKPAFWLIIVAVIACIVAGACFLTNPLGSDIDDELAVFLDMHIAEHHRSEQTDGNFISVDYKVMGRQNSWDQTTVYMWVLYNEYSFDGEIEVEASAHVPTVITAEKIDGEYELVEYWEPRDGSDYADDIRRKFPLYLHGKALDSQLYIEEQEANCLKSAQEYFSSSIADVGDTDLPDAIPALICYTHAAEMDTSLLMLMPITREFAFTPSFLSSYFGRGHYEVRRFDHTENR